MRQGGATSMWDRQVLAETTNVAAYPPLSRCASCPSVQPMVGGAVIAKLAAVSDAPNRDRATDTGAAAAMARSSARTR